MFNSQSTYQFSIDPVFLYEDSHLTANLDWVVQNVYFDKSKALTPTDLTPIVNGLHKLISVEFFDDIDRIFDWVKTYRMHTGILICFLRVTGQFRKNIHTWHDFKRQVERELTDRGEDLSRKLRGLPDV